MLCVGFHKMFPITTIIAITTKNFFFIQSHSFAKFKFCISIIDLHLKHFLKYYNNMKLQKRYEFKMLFIDCKGNYIF